MWASNFDSATFPLNFFMKVSQKMLLNVFYTMVQKVKNEKTQIKGGPALKGNSSPKSFFADWLVSAQRRGRSNVSSTSKRKCGNSGRKIAIFSAAVAARAPYIIDSSGSLLKLFQARWSVSRPRSAGDKAWRRGENAWACRAALGSKKFARADHHDILEKRISRISWWSARANFYTTDYTTDGEFLM